MRVMQRQSALIEGHKITTLPRFIGTKQSSHLNKPNKLNKLYVLTNLTLDSRLLTGSRERLVLEIKACKIRDKCPVYKVGDKIEYA